MSVEILQCNKCPKSFATKGKYNQHLKTHSKPFRCEPCQRGFALRLDLARHVKARHSLGFDALCCSFEKCRFVTKRKENLRRHLRNKHKDAIQTGQDRELGESADEDVLLSSPSSISSIAHTNPIQADNCILFMQAATAGNLTVLQACLNSGIDIDARAIDGSTALHCAARAGQTEAAQYLIDREATVDYLNDSSRTPLKEAILGRCPDTVKVLLHQTPQTMTRVAELKDCIVQSESLEIVSIYTEHIGEPLDTELDRHLLVAAIKFGRTAFFAALLELSNADINGKNFLGDSLLHQAVRYGRSEILKALLASKNVDLNTSSHISSEHPIHIAAKKGNLEIMAILLSQKDINISIPSRAGKALHIASDCGHAEMVKLLLGQGAFDINSQDDVMEKTPLHYAAQNGHLEIVSILLSEESINQHCTDSDGRRPIHLAASNRHWDIVSMLLYDIDESNMPSADSGPAQEQEGKDVLEVIERLLSHHDFQDINAMIYNGKSLLHNAILNFDNRLTKFLLAHKDIDVNVKGNDFNLYDGCTPLHCAARSNNIEGAKLLLEHKDIKLLSDYHRGWTALREARTFNRKEIVDLILSRFS